MKRFLAGAMAIIMTLSLAACGAKEAPAASSAAPEGGSTAAAPAAPAGEKVKLAYWSPFSGGDGDFMKQMVADFNAQSETTEVEFLIFKSEEYYTKLLAAMTSDTAPDIAISHISRLQEFVEDSLIIPLDDLGTAAGVDWTEFTQTLQDTSKIGDKHYAIPLDTHLLLIHYNKAMLTEMGMMNDDGTPKMEPGKEGFMKFFTEILGKVPAGTMPISGTSKGGLPMYLWYTFLTQLGGDMLADDNKTVTLDTPANIEALTIINEMVTSGIWPKNQKNGAEIFTAKKATTTMNGTWGVPIFEGVEGLEFVSLPFPQLTDTKSVYADSHTLVIPAKKDADPAKQAASVEFMDWLSDNTIAWAMAGQIPSKTAILESAEYKALPYRSDYAKSAEYASIMPQSTKLVGMIEVVQRELATMITGEQDPAKTAANMQAECTKLFA